MKIADNVIGVIADNGYCVGCGACASICPNQNLKITWNKYGEYQPEAFGKCNEKCALCLQVCPRYFENENESQIAESQFSGVTHLHFNEHAGYYIDCFSGHVNDRTMLNKAASGGLCTALLKSMLEENIVDGVVCVRPNEDPDKLFNFFIARTQSDLESASSSAYYPVEMSEVLREIINSDNECYAMVGLPCYLTAVSLIQKKVPKLKGKIKYKIGLVCGSLPNKQFNEKVFKALKLSKKDIQSIRYRETSKFPNRFKGIKITDIHGNEHLGFSAHEGKTRRSSKYIYTACMFCSDVFAETADAVFMDAWLPDFRKKHYGTSLVLYRNKEIQRIFLELKKNQIINLEKIGLEGIINSQGSRISNKGLGLSYRVETCKKWGIPFPENLSFAMHNTSGLKNKVKREIAFKLIQNLRAHDKRIKLKFLLDIFVFFPVIYFREKAECFKDTIRKAYYSYKYLNQDTLKK